VSNINGFEAPAPGTRAPDWAITFNESFNVFDSHDHSNGKGVQLSFDVVNFINDFTCPIVKQIENLQFSAKSPKSKNTLYSDGFELFFIDGFNRVVKITEDGHLNIPTQTGGGFTGEYVSSNAQVTYTSATSTYTFLGENALQKSTIQCDKLGYFEDINFNNSTLTINDFEITCATFSIPFSPAPTGSNQVIYSASLGTVTDLAPYVMVTTASPAANYSTLIYDAPAPPPSFQYYSAIFDGGSLPKLYIVGDRSDVKYTDINFDFLKPLTPIMGGISQAPLLYVNKNDKDQSISYRDDLILSSDDKNFWSNDIIFSFGRDFSAP